MAIDVLLGRPHKACHDLESFLYVLIWYLFNYKPDGTKHVLVDEYGYPKVNHFHDSFGQRSNNPSEAMATRKETWAVGKYYGAKWWKADLEH